MHPLTRSLVTLGTANAIGQAIAVVGGGVVAVLFTPDAVGRWSLLLNLQAMLCLVATLRTEVRLVLGGLDDDDADRDLRRGLAGCCLVALALCLALAAWALAPSLPRPAIDAQAMAATPLAVLLAGGGMVVLAWWQRRDRVARVGLAGVLRSGGTLAGQAGGAAWLGAPALVWGSLLGWGLGVATCWPGRDRLAAGWRTLRAELAPAALGHHWRLCGQALLTESITVVAGLAVLTAHGEAAAGVFYLAFRLLQMPLNLAYNPLRQAVALHLSTPAGRPASHRLAWLASLPWGVRAAFAVVLGGYLALAASLGWLDPLLARWGWGGAGSMGRWLCLFFFCSIATIPAQAMLLRLGRSGTILGLSGVQLVLRLAGLAAGWPHSGEAMAIGLAAGSMLGAAVFSWVGFAAWRRQHGAPDER